MVILARRRPDAVRIPSTPTGIALGAGAVAMVVAGVIAAAIPAGDAGWRFAVMAIAVGLFAAISLDQVALLAIAVLAFAISNGFLEDRFGQLAWHGSQDLWRLLLIVMAGAFGLAVGEAVRFVRGARARRRGPRHDPTRADDDVRSDVNGGGPAGPYEWSDDKELMLRFGVAPIHLPETDSPKAAPGVHERPNT